MSVTVFDSILRDHEIKNEKRVAYIRFIPASVIVLEILAYFDLVSFVVVPTTSGLLLSLYLLIYSSVILGLLLKGYHTRYFKYFVIFLDYANVTASYFFDPVVTKQQSDIIWYAFIGTIFFYLLNLLRYSKMGTIYSGILSVTIFVGVNIYYESNVTEVITLLFPYLIIMLIGYSVTTSHKTMMIEANAKKMMERYLPPQLVGEFYKQNVNLEPGGKNQKVTILFSDIRSFTTISENKPASEVVDFLNEYLSTMTDIIFENQGTIDKFIGDSIMTIFGAPIQKEDDALRSVRTAIAMIKAMKNFNSKFSNIEQPIEIGIGIHTGNVIAGNIGSNKRLDYTVIGDNVNLSSRIEGLTSYYNCPILVSESTYKEVLPFHDESSFCFIEVDKVKVKGKLNQVTIYQVLFYDSLEEKQKIMDTKDKFENALKLYRNQKFQESKDILNSLENFGPTEIYKQRCQELILSPPNENWDATHTMLKK